MKTKSAVLYENSKPLVIQDLTIPKLKPGQVLVKISYTGICHSQLNEIKGLKGEDKFLPHCLGHEAGGVVEKIGPNVTKVKPGDHVVLSWIKGSGMNVPSTKYMNEKNQVVNAGAITTFSEYSVISENRVTPISKKMPLDRAALLGCAIPTGGGIIVNQIDPEPGCSMLVVGVGGIGLSSVLLADIMKCNPIVAVDINDEKLKYAKKLGATDILNSTKNDFVSFVRNLTEELGVDYAIEAAGTKSTIEKSFESVKWNGGLVVIAGNPPEGEKICIDPFELKGKKITGSWGGLTNPDVDIPKYIDMYLSGKLNLDDFITDRFRFEEINDALTLLDDGKILGRGIIEF